MGWVLKMMVNHENINRVVMDKDSKQNSLE